MGWLGAWGPGAKARRPPRRATLDTEQLAASETGRDADEARLAASLGIEVPDPAPDPAPKPIAGETRLEALVEALGLDVTKAPRAWSYLARRERFLSENEWLLWLAALWASRPIKHDGSKPSKG